MDGFRENVEEKLLGLPGVRRLGEREAKFIEDYKDGTFGLSYLGFLLYCNGRNPRGLSSHPNGLMYFDKENLFGIGIFRREHEERFGHMMIVAPRGIGTMDAIDEFVTEAKEAAPELRNQLVYARFLKKEQMLDLFQRGFHPVQSEPWHPEAFAEDETFNHAVVRLSDIYEPSSEFRIKNAASSCRAGFMRFTNFLERYGAEWRNERYSSEIGKGIVRAHFQMLDKAGKRIGSVAEDYFNILEADKSGRFARVMKLRKGGKEVAAAVFIGENVSEKRMALYCTIARRDSSQYMALLNLREQPVGFGALSIYSFLQAFGEIKNEFAEIEEVHLGGSETADMNAFKRRLGAKNEPTYWAVKRI